mmetsp:Transcript_39201/g.116608  ORF Transcript_39201/g.116608 Transcript_39201/m.116608 type:complete len:216 (-) Transcript_39201:855-1502(-)
MARAAATAAAKKGRQTEGARRITRATSTCWMRGWPLDEAALKIGGSCTLMTPGGCGGITLRSRLRCSRASSSRSRLRSPTVPLSSPTVPSGPSRITSRRQYFALTLFSGSSSSPSQQTRSRRWTQTSERFQKNTCTACFSWTCCLPFQSIGSQFSLPKAQRLPKRTSTCCCTSPASSLSRWDGCTACSSSSPCLTKRWSCRRLRSCSSATGCTCC